MLETALRRDRLVVTLALLAVAGFAWVYLIHYASLMRGHMDMGMGMAMPDAMPWSIGETAGLALMWSIMMVAMMLPSVTPVILLFAGVTRRRRQQGVLAAPVSVFVLGYLLAWVGFAIVAALGQSLLHSAALLSPAMASSSPLLGGALLIVAGAYQWLPAIPEQLVLATPLTACP